MLSAHDIQRRFFGLPPGANSYPFRSPRFWHGMRLGDWLKLLARNRFQVHPLCWFMALTVTGTAGVNSVLSFIQQFSLGRRIAETPIEEPPIFVVGHWRSGTTYLHELLALDPRFAAPTTYQCFAPAHFLISEPIFGFWLPYLLPAHRPMDNVRAGVAQPQEDEFALCVLGAPTPYLQVAFPNEPAVCLEFLDMLDIPEDRFEHWKNTMCYFVRAITFRERKQLVLKSPPHTGRIATLSEMFPGSKFIHVVRDPLAMVPSTVRLWQSLYATQAFQIPRHSRLEDYVIDCFEKMYLGFDQQRRRIHPKHLCHVRYEDLVADPVGQLAIIYEKLRLGDFDVARPILTRHFESSQGYRTNRHHVPDALRDRIMCHWGPYMKAYGYAMSEGHEGRGEGNAP